jgi:hypothetical protein
MPPIIPYILYIETRQHRRSAMQMKMKYKNKAELIEEVYGAGMVSPMFNADQLFANIVDTLRVQQYDVKITRRGIEIIDAM